MSRKTKFNHPLHEVRTAISKTQSEFAKMFGVSASYIQAIELGKRNISPEFADDIMIQLGIEAESLKRQRGLPRSLLRSGKAKSKTASPKVKKLAQEFAALQSETDPRERLRARIEFYQKIFPYFASEIRYQDFVRKLEVFFSAAARDEKHLPVIMRLDRWLENAAKDFRLRAAIMKVAGRNYAVDWHPFKDVLFRSLPFLPPQEKRAATSGR
jgi:transcriptional regulator with XRE-family HTH domain